MPFVRAPSSLSAAPHSRFRTSLRIAFDALLVASVAFGLLLLLVRFVVLPRVDDNRARIEQMLSRQIGHRVELGPLTTGWNGWNPRLDVRDLRIMDGDRASVVIPETHLTVSWTSLLFLDLRLKELSLFHPHLTIARDEHGMLHLAGMMIDPAQDAGNGRVIEWVLRQPRVSIRDGQISWRDELRQAPEITLDHVDLRAENRFGRYRFGLTAVPPADFAAPLDVRADLTVASSDTWRTPSGRIYVRVAYADMAALHQWLPANMPIADGKGAVRVWLGLERGEPREMVGDVVLADVRAQLADDLPPLALARLEGRLGFSDDGRQREVTGQHVELLGAPDVHLGPSDFKLSMRYGASDSTGGSMDASNIELMPLRQIASSLPLPQVWREHASKWAPHGRIDDMVSQWSGDLSVPQAYTFSGHLSEVGIAAHESIPAISGVSGELAGTQRDGSLKLASRDLIIQFSQGSRGAAAVTSAQQSFAFDNARGEIRWRKEGDGMTLAADRLALDNSDLAVVVSGEYTTGTTASATAKIDAQLSRADLHQMYRYIPGPAEWGVRDWLRKSLVAGTVSDGRLKLSGALADFPFADPKKGQFQASFKAHAATLDYAAGWPPVNNIEGEFRIDGPRIAIETRSGRIFDAAVERLKVDIADVRIQNPVVRLDGQAAGATNEFLRFVAESPVDGWLDHVLRGAVAKGDGRLLLKLEMPIGQHEGDQINGEFAFNGDYLNLAGDVPDLDKLNGKIIFTKKEISSTGLVAEIFGGPAQLAIKSVDGRVNVNGKGDANLALLRAAYPKQPLATRLAGTTDWRFDMKLQPEAAAWVLDSTLKGAIVDLPVPAAKTASSSVALHVERRPIDANNDSLTINYGTVGRLSLQRRLTADGPVPERGLLALGKATGDADRRGMWVRGDIDTLDLDAWLALKAKAEENSGPMDMPLSGFDLNAGTLGIFGRQLHDLRMGGSRTGGDWQVDLRGRELAGSAHWQGPASGRPNGRIVAQLQRLTLPTATANPLPAPAATTAALTADNSWPAIDVVADTFLRKNRDLGKLELVALPRGMDWRIETLKLTNADGKLSANGWWRGGGRSQQTTLETELDVSDAGKFLARFEMPDQIRGAATKIKGQMSWAGGPQDFDYPTLTGQFRIETGAGQFTKLDPGLGKLLGVLSLQSLKRRLTFDFQDLFGEGFAFDDISGDVRVQDGVMKSDDLKIVGPSARVGISGEADIARETQQLRVRVQPTLSGSVSVGAAALLLANPLVGAAVAAGSLLAQTIMQDPIEKMFAYEYAVTGSWADPIVARDGKTSAAPPAAASTAPLIAPPTVSPTAPASAPAPPTAAAKAPVETVPQ